MTQKELIKYVLETLRHDVDTADAKYAPAKGKLLVKHVHGKPVSGDFNYSYVG